MPALPDPEMSPPHSQGNNAPAQRQWRGAQSKGHLGFTAHNPTEDSTPVSEKGAPTQGGPGRLTIGCSHLPPASHAVQPNGGALGEGEGPEAGRNRLVGQHLVSGHRRPGCRLQKESKMQ